MPMFMLPIKLESRWEFTPPGLSSGQNVSRFNGLSCQGSQKIEDSNCWKSSLPGRQRILWRLDDSEHQMWSIILGRIVMRIMQQGCSVTDASEICTYYIVGRSQDIWEWQGVLSLSKWCLYRVTSETCRLQGHTLNHSAQLWSNARVLLTEKSGNNEQGTASIIG